MNTHHCLPASGNIIGHIKDYCYGRWDTVIEAITGFTGKPSYCPQHGGKSGKAFYGKKHHYAQTGITFCNTCGCRNDGINTLAFITGQSISEVIKMLVGYIGDIKIGEQPVVAVKPCRNTNKHDKQAQYNIDKLYQKSVELGHAKAYFINRGLKPLVNCYYHDIRFAKNVSHYEERQYKQHDAVLGIMRHLDNRICNIQRIFIDDHGNKVDCHHPKKMMPTPETGWHNGAAVWMRAILNQWPHVLNVSEGIENGHAVLSQSPFHVDMACALTAANLAKFKIPTGIQKLVIWADNDGETRTKQGNIVNAGIDYATQLKHRAESIGVEAIIVAPEKIGDWNDYLIPCRIAWDNIVLPFITNLKGNPNVTNT